MDLILLYALAELLLSVHISLSNLLVLWVYVRKRHVRTVTNTYIFSLALTDFLAGSLGIPITVLSVLTKQPHSFYGCLLVHLILCILCTISTFHMLAIALDKYITICCKKQIFNSRHSRAFTLLSLAWSLGTVIAVLPLFNAFGFAETIHSFKDECAFTKVVDYRYLVYVIFFATIVAPTLLIIFFYSSIYHKIRQDEKEVTFLLREKELERRMAGRRKIIRILLILVVSYGICWYPLYIINTIEYFLPQFSIARYTLCAVVLSHLSCALNPLIYAYGMPGFKKSLREFFHIDTLDHGTKGVCNVYSCYCRSSMSHKSHSNKRKRSSQNQIQVQVHHRPLRVPGHSVDIRPRTATPPRQHQSDYHNRKISAPTRFNSKGSTPTNNSTPTHNNAEDNNSNYDNVKINIDNNPYEIKFIEEATRNEPDYI